MSFLGGALDRQDPSERVRQALTRDLELRRSAGKSDVRFSSHVHKGSADLLLNHGRFYPGRPVPEEYLRYCGPLNHCYLNALEAAEADPSLSYCEGVYTTGYGHPRSHAWCVAPDGGVVEVTMPSDPAQLARSMSELGLPYLPPDHWGYYGVVFRPELPRYHFDNLSLPMFDRSNADIAHCRKHGLDADATHDYPILKLPYDPNRTELS